MLQNQNVYNSTYTCRPYVCFVHPSCSWPFRAQLSSMMWCMRNNKVENLFYFTPAWWDPLGNTEKSSYCNENDDRYAIPQQGRSYFWRTLTPPNRYWSVFCDSEKSGACSAHIIGLLSPKQPVACTNRPRSHNGVLPHYSKLVLKWCSYKLRNCG